MKQPSTLTSGSPGQHSPGRPARGPDLGRGRRSGALVRPGRLVEYPDHGSRRQRDSHLKSGPTVSSIDRFEQAEVGFGAASARTRSPAVGTVIRIVLSHPPCVVRPSALMVAVAFIPFDATDEINELSVIPRTPTSAGNDKPATPCGPGAIMNGRTLVGAPFSNGTVPFATTRYL